MRDVVVKEKTKLEGEEEGEEFGVALEAPKKIR